MHARADVHARDGLGGGALTGVLATANKDGPTQRDRDGHRMGETGFANLDEGKLREIKGNQGNSCIAATFFFVFQSQIQAKFWGQAFFHLDLPTAVDELGLHQNCECSNWEDRDSETYLERWN